MDYFQLSVRLKLIERATDIGRQEHRDSLAELLGIILIRAVDQWKTLAIQGLVAPPIPEHEPAKKIVRVTINSTLRDQIRHIAQQNHRSFTSQVEYMLELGVDNWSRLSGQQPWSDVISTDNRRVPTWAAIA